MKPILAILFLALSLEARAFTLVFPDPGMEGWNTDVLRFHLNLENCPDGVESLIDEALDLWNAVPTSRLRLERGDYTSETLDIQTAGQGQLVPGIFCISDMAALGADPDSIPGRAAGFRRTGSHISSGSLILNVDPTGSANIETMDPTLVKVVIAHEVGHILGLGHSEDNASLMYYNATTKKHLALAADDANGLTYLYPRNELGSDPLMGCATVGGLGRPVGPLALLVLPLLWGCLFAWRRSGP